MKTTSAMARKFANVLLSAGLVTGAHRDRAAELLAEVIDSHPAWESYGLFDLRDGEPLTWIEFNGDQQVLLDKMRPGQGVFGAEIRIPRPKTGAVCP